MPPKEIKYSVSDLRSFLAKDDNPVVEFYGGEPLLRVECMKKMMDEIPARFVLQTNGQFLDRIEPSYLRKFHSILVSIDGTRDTTDKQRGKGVHDRVIRNVELLREKGFLGDFVARMTVTQGTDIYENVCYLLDIGLFDHVHWQLDFTMFWDLGEDAKPGLGNWLDEYNSGISSLVDYWIAEMSLSNRVLGLVPFIGITNSLLSGWRSQLRCGSGIDFFAVMPDGRISACPVSIDFDFSVVGSIFKSVPSSLRNRATVGEPCVSCDIFDVCGGRCLFVNRSQEMLRKNGYHYICTTVRHLVKKLKDAIPQIQTFVENQSVKRSDFLYPEFNNGCEIIP